MNGLPGFGVMLARLLEYRKLDVAGLSGLAGFSDAELRVVLDGVPDLLLLQRLAPALGLHAADLLVIAGEPVPDELAPLERRAGRLVPVLAGYAMRLPAETRGQLLGFVESLPRQDRTGPAEGPRTYEQYPPGFGGVLLRLVGNRNLDWASTGQLLYLLAGLVLSGSTVAMVGRGRKEVTPDLLAGFAAVLGFPVGELAALGGVDLPSELAPPNPAAGDIAELIWHARRLTADQVEQARSRALSLQR